MTPSDNVKYATGPATRINNNKSNSKNNTVVAKKQGQYSKW